MSELKHTFTSGRMDKDRDERLLKNGSYRDALNIQISSSEGSDVGAIENLLGNEKLSKLGLINATTIGAIAYNLKDKLYWFVTSNELDGIYEYDEKNKEVVPILLDTKNTNTTVLSEITIDSNIDSELILREYNVSDLKQICGISSLPIIKNQEVLINNNIIITSEDPNITISIPKNTVLQLDENSDVVFKNIIYDGIKYGNIDISAETISAGILNFSKNNLITGLNIIDDILFWTDNLNEPRRIHIPTFKKYTALSEGSETQVEYIVKNLETKESYKDKRPLQEHDLTVIRKYPLSAPVMELYDSITDGVVNIQESINLSNYEIGDVIEIKNRSINPSWKVGDFVNITSLNGQTNLTASVKSITDDIALSKLIELSITTIDGDIIDSTEQYLIELKQKKALYELNFVRFAYRWKYKNGEYSVFSPFTEPAFMSSLFRYDGKEAFNYGMINKLQRIKLIDFDKGDDTVEEIDILLKEGRNQNIYTLKTVKKLDFDGTFEITKEQIHSIIPNDQLFRQWDNVPKRAKAQDVTANRIIYGNYYQNYNVYSDPEFEISLTGRKDSYKRTIKSDRTYQLGVVYMDEYGRQTPVLSNDSATYKIDKSNSIAKNKFQIKLNNQPPAWATHFKYFVKDTSGEYYNLAADKFYQDTENGFTYISFPSSDRNKITADNYLILKKKHGSNDPILDNDNRYKIIDIFADPPEFITNRKRNIYSIGDIIFTDDYSGAGGGAAIINREQIGAAGGAPYQDYAVFQMKKAVDGQNGGNGVPLADANELKPGRFIQFTFQDKSSKTYEIKSVQQHPSGSNEVKVTVTEPFGEDINIIYSKVAPYNLGNDGDNLGISINILETYSAAGDKEFDGRFFVKLKTNSTLTDSIIKEAVGGKSYLAKIGIPLNGIYPREYDSYRNDNNYKNSARYKPRALTDPPNHFIVSDGGSTTNGSTPETGKYTVFGNLKYNITLEQSTHRNDADFEQRIKQIKVGDFVRFKNDDGTLHHDTIYEIGAVKTHTKTGQKQGNTGRRDIKCISLHFINENGEFKELDKAVCTRNQNTTGNEPIMEILQELNEENILIKDPAIFETEPIEQKTELDIYYETEKAFPKSLHGQTQEIEWYNAISFGNGVESNRIRDDFNAIFIDNGVKASTVLAEPFKEEHKFNGLIWSGIINSRSGTNQSNQFNMANAITKDLLPSYGSIQKLFARDSDLVIYCEDKVVRALADKNILYNADGSANIIASNKVIGDIVPFAGEYGISTNPESFCFYGFRAYCTDAKRGVVLRLSGGVGGGDGLTPISKADMNDFFRDRLFSNTGYLIGSYDNRNSLYNISFENLDTVCFSENVQGWVSRKSFIPEWAISLNDKYYTYRNGELWIHDSPASSRNNFYNIQYTSKIEFDINDDPSTIKKYKTISYEGTSGWVADVSTDQQKSSQITFIDKENKYFANIKGEDKTLANIDVKNMSVQGIGRSVRKPGEDDYLDQLGDVSNTTATFKLILSTSNAGVANITKTQAPGTAISTIKFIIYPNNGYEIKASNFYHKDITFIQNGKNIEAILNFNSVQPNIDTTYSYNVDGKATKTPITVSGSFTILGFNYIIDTPKTGTFTVTGAYGTEQIISERIVNADLGYFIENKNITVNNSTIRIKKIKLSSTRFKIIESIFIPKNNTTLNYQISITPTEEPVVNPILISKHIDTNDLSNNEETRDLTLFGEPNASFKLDLADSSNSIYNVTKTFDSTGQIILPLIFPAGNIAETYTIKIDTLAGTNFGDDFGSNTIIIDRTVRERKKVIFSILYSSTITENFVLEDYKGESFSNENFDFTLTLPAGSYVVVKNPLNSDVVYGINENGASVTIEDFSFDAVNTNELTISGFLNINELIADEIYTLDISSLIGENITTTFDVSIVDKNGASTGNFTAASTTYTVSGGAGSIVTPSDTYHYFQLTPSAGYLFPDTLDADDFEILDSTNASVLSTYAANGELLLKRIGNNISIGFKTISFTQPDIASTFTIYPKPGTITDAIPVGNTVGTLGVNINIESYIDGLPFPLVSFGNLSPYTFSKSYSNFDGATIQLFQAKINVKSDQAKAIIDASQFSDTNLFNFNSKNIELTLASAGTYPLAASSTPGSNVTITGPYEYNISTFELTINFLIDISSLGAPLTVNLKGVAAINLRSDKYYYDGTLYDKYSLVSIKEAGCDEIKNSNLQWSTLDANDNVYPKYWIEDPNAITTDHPISQNLRDGIILYKQENSSIVKPGVKLRSISAIIEKGFLSLFSTGLTAKISKGKECNIVPDDNNDGDAPQFIPRFEIGGQYSGDMSIIHQQNFYNDIAETEMELINEAYKDQEITLTGTFKTQKLYEYGESLERTPTNKNHSPHMVDTKSPDMVFSSSGNASDTWMFEKIADSTMNVDGPANYKYVKKQLEEEAGLTGLAAEPLQGVDELIYDKFGKGTWKKKILFDSNGKAKFKVWAYRGARAYRVHLTINGAYSKRYWEEYDFYITYKNMSAAEAHEAAWRNVGNVGFDALQADGNLFLNVISMVRYKVSAEATRKQASYGLYQDYTILPWDIDVSRIRQGERWIEVADNGGFFASQFQALSLGYRSDGAGANDQSTIYNGQVIIHKDYTNDPTHEGYMVLQKYCDPNLVYPWSHGFADYPLDAEISVWNPYIPNVNKYNVGFGNQTNDFGGYAKIKNKYKTDIELKRSELYGSDGESARDGYNDYTIVSSSDKIAESYIEYYLSQTAAPYGRD